MHSIYDQVWGLIAFPICVYLCAFTSGLNQGCFLEFFTDYSTMMLFIWRANIAASNYRDKSSRKTITPFFVRPEHFNVS